MFTKTEKTQMWLAVFLTAGEWAIAIFMCIHKGELVMIYLAVTYALRETKGGKHYHHIIGEGIKTLYPKLFPEDQGTLP